ncbi:MAG: SufE family protein [Bacteroidales bacterium]|nr:SufE family protein [Bacteroidales bacterium]
MNINEIQNQIIEEFSTFNDWLDKYNYIIELGKNMPPLSEEYKTDNNIIEGCQSKVWLHAEYKDNKVFYYADSDAIITKGLISLLIRVYSGQTPDDIINTQPWFIEKIGLHENLSPTRSNGLLAMIKKIKLYALAFKEKNKQ